MRPCGVRSPRKRGRESEEVAVRFEVFGRVPPGSHLAMTPSSILVIVIGIVLALLVHYALGIIVILIGLAMLLLPVFSGTRRA